MPSVPFQHTVVDRFLRYVRLDTQSDPTSATVPSTAKQKDLGRLLVQELREMGVRDADMDDAGYVYATIPGNSPRKVPVICLCSHMDTAPDCSGAGVKPIIHRHYHGEDIVLPDDPSQVIRLADHPHLKDQLGNDIITASGTTLLGADNKAGVAEIMDAARILLQHPDILHGDIRLLFTPDEEIGRGVDHVDLQRLDADFAYTVDGEMAGSLENETFSADQVTIEFKGVSVHPGFAKGKMEHAMKMAAALIHALPTGGCSPETTEGRQGFIHPTSVEGSLEHARLTLLIRDFTTEKLAEHEALLKNTLDKVMEDYPNSSATFTVLEQYRNMKVVLDRHPEVIRYAEEAIRRAGLTPRLSSIRGGTDGSRLSFMGLPCPNIFAGEHAFHSRQEWVSVQDMEKAVLTLVHLVQVWEENSPA
ncbi:MAG: peptidase Metallo peptidase family [Bacteroidota bacterium]